MAIFMLFKGTKKADWLFPNGFAGFWVKITG
jgi:hypothetical protein